MNKFDVIVIGGGQSGLALGYYLRRSGLNYIILDNKTEAGGAWLHGWESLRLFSPAQWSSLPGMIMPGGSDYYPSLDNTIEYLKAYEKRYDLPVRRPIHVEQVLKNREGFEIETSEGTLFSRAVISATGSFDNAYIPYFEGMELFRGRILHSALYRSAQEFANKKVVIVGEGNSGAQILAEISQVADTLWITQREPTFLPDHVDGRYLFDAASQMYEAQKQGKRYIAPSLGNIVMVASVKDARSRDVLKSERAFKKFTTDSIIRANGFEEKIDAIIFCTGFKPSLKHLESLNIVNADGRINTVGTRSEIEGLWLVGYGNWTGFASATLIGVGRSAKITTEELVQFLQPVQNNKVYGIN